MNDLSEKVEIKKIRGNSGGGKYNKMKNSLKVLNGRHEMAGERIRKCSYKSIEFILSE